MAIPYAQILRIALGNETDFADRTLFALRREAAYKMPTATGRDLIACQAVWANVTDFRFPVTLAILADQFFTVSDVATLLATPDNGPGSIQAAVGSQWANFVKAMFPAGA